MGLSPQGSSQRRSGDLARPEGTRALREALGLQTPQCSPSCPETSLTGLNHWPQLQPTAEAGWQCPSLHAHSVGVQGAGQGGPSIPC